MFVIGDVKDPGEDDALPLAKQMWDDIKDRTSLRLIKMVEDDLPAQSKVSRIWGETRGQATNRDCALVLAHADGIPALDVHGHQVGDATRLIGGWPPSAW